MQLPVLVFNPLRLSSFFCFSPNHISAQRRLTDTAAPAAAAFLSRTSKQQPTRAIRTSSKKIILPSVSLGIYVRCSSKDVSHGLPEPLVVSLYLIIIIDFFF